MDLFFSVTNLPGEYVQISMQNTVKKLYFQQCLFILANRLNKFGNNLYSNADESRPRPHVCTYFTIVVTFNFL